MNQKTVIDILEERGFIDAITSEELKTKAHAPLKVYCGFDPTSDSLHIGNMVAIMGLAWFQKYGHTPVAIVGGATGMIGDPSGKSSERQLLDRNTIDRNLVGIRKNLEAILSQKGPQALLFNNYDWFQPFSLLEFLRDVGKHFRIGVMLAKDSVKGRMTSEEGMSFTEFTYQILQAYDFLYLFRTHQVEVQLGGSDQWGNITAGTELIRKLTGKTAYGITFPLLTKADGQKFGKSEKGAIWLSGDKLSPYEFFQYLFRSADADVITLMKLLTFMEMDEIRHYEKEMKKESYIPNSAQKRLAEEVTKIVHGEEGLQIALKVTQGAAPGANTELNREILESIASNMPNHSIKSSEVFGTKLIDFLVKIGAQNSKGEARRLMQNGGIAVNNQKIMDEHFVLGKDLFIDGSLLLLALGKKNKLLIRISDL